jgi:hypothetical protein
MKRWLSTNGNYKNLRSNPISKVIKAVKKVIEESNPNERMKTQLTLSCKITHRIYDLLKIHKEGVPLRSIVNTIRSLACELEKYVEKLLGPLVCNTNSFIKYLSGEPH